MLFTVTFTLLTDWLLWNVADTYNSIHLIKAGSQQKRLHSQCNVSLQIFVANSPVPNVWNDCMGRYLSNKLGRDVEYIASYSVLGPQTNKS